MDIDTITLTIKESRYYHQSDEAAFYEWLDKINSIKRYYGYIRDFHLDIQSDIDEDDFRSLLSLFYRYNLDLTALRLLETSKNRGWLKNPKAYWYDEIWGDSLPRSD